MGEHIELHAKTIFKSHFIKQFSDRLVIFRCSWLDFLRLKAFRELSKKAVGCRVKKPIKPLSVKGFKNLITGFDIMKPS
jgi:hypothetical protein